MLTFEIPFTGQLSQCCTSLSAKRVSIPDECHFYPVVIDTMNKASVSL